MTVIQIDRLVNHNWNTEFNFYYPDLLICNINKIISTNLMRRNGRLVEFIPIEKAIKKYNLKQLIK